MIANLAVQALLAQRGKVGASLVDYTLIDRGDGQGAQIGEWNTTTLGPVPTQAEIDALTPAQITAAQTAQKTAAYTATSRNKDILATCALIVRAKGAPAWNALTTPQKVAATLAEADVWVTIRNFIEDNL